MILLFLFLSIFLAVFKCSFKKSDRQQPPTLKTQVAKTETQVPKTDNQVKTEASAIKKVAKCVNDATFIKKINPPQNPYEEQVTQKSISVKLKHDDDTLKNVESLRPDEPSTVTNLTTHVDKESTKG
uniref:Uncharacterized protein n=1 Tax=Strongyloides venezuelensis TaxID=75913 RepID=A0A0K0G3Q5_STRVS